MKALKDNLSKIEVVSSALLKEENILKSNLWIDLQKILKETNEIAGVAILSNEKRDPVEIVFMHIGESQKKFFDKYSSESRIAFFKDIKTHPGWTSDDYENLYNLKVGDFAGALSLAEEIIKRLNPEGRTPQSIWQICGPINHGPKSREKNIEIFFDTILRHSHQWYVFDQIPFIPVFDSWEKSFEWKPEDCVVVNEFFKKLFETKLMSKLGFIYGFQDSFGAAEEHEIALKLSHLSLYHLPDGYQKNGSINSIECIKKAIVPKEQLV